MRSYFTTFRERSFEFLLGGMFLILSLYIYSLALEYSNLVAKNPVSDLILDNIPHVDVIGLIAYGTILFLIFLISLGLKVPHSIPYVFESISLFVCVRSFFMILTHIAPQPTQYFGENSAWMFSLLGGADLFFSGHTGLPFLLALIFWKNRGLRYVFLLFSLSGAILVLIARLHYSIDVFAAYFIVYGIHQISMRLFPLSWQLVSHVIPRE